ncbi:hypothetical protein TcG_07352 [Trypanosoma cruzi]|nr:hypothetical protein TcG_07352 [Trypanosoma cruzi]
MKREKNNSHTGEDFRSRFLFPTQKLSQKQAVYTDSGKHDRSPVLFLPPHLRASMKLLALPSPRASEPKALQQRHTDGVLIHTSGRDSNPIPTAIATYKCRGRRHPYLPQSQRTNAAFHAQPRQQHSYAH